MSQRKKTEKGRPGLLFRSARREVRILPVEREGWRLLLASEASASEQPIPPAQLGQVVVQKLELIGDVPAARLPIEFESRRALGFIRRSTWPAHDWVWNFDVRCADGSTNCRGQESSLAAAIESCAKACLKYESD